MIGTADIKRQKLAKTLPHPLPSNVANFFLHKFFGDILRVSVKLSVQYPSNKSTLGRAVNWCCYLEESIQACSVCVKKRKNIYLMQFEYHCCEKANLRRCVLAVNYIGELKARSCESGEAGVVIKETKRLGLKVDGESIRRRSVRNQFAP